MGTSASGAAAARIRTIFSAVAATGATLMLALGLAPLTGFAQESVAGGFTPPESENDARGASPDSATDAPILASGLVGNLNGIVSAEVALDAPDPLIGSFTVDGLTFAVSSDSVTFIAVDVSAVAEDGSVSIPATVTYNGATYRVTAIGSYAFYLSGATQVELPDSITSVDDRTFRSSDVERVTVDADNPNMNSFDGALYSTDLSSLLLIPEGRAGSVSIPSETEVAEPSVFSHCSLVEAIDVDGDGAAFASWGGLLYSADGATLLRVPAGATEITIRDGCATIAAGALEGCANLERIHAPSTVTSINPDVFTSVPTVSLPATALSENAPQLTSTVALAVTDESLPGADLASITVALPDYADRVPWERLGLKVEGGSASNASRDVEKAANDESAAESGVVDESPLAPTASLGAASTYSAHTFTIRNVMALDSDDQFYYIQIGLDASTNKLTLLREAGANHFNNIDFGSTVDGQWNMENSPYGLILLRTDAENAGKGFILTRQMFNPSYPTTFTSVASFLDYYTPYDCAYYIKTDGSMVYQPANYNVFSWSQVTQVCVTPGPSILETFHRNDGSGETFEKWLARGWSWQTSPSTSRSGYTSTGWWTDASGGSKYADMGESSTAGTYSSITARTTRSYYAQWTKNAIYTVTLDSQLWESSTAATAACSATNAGTANIYYWVGKGWYSESNPAESDVAATTATALITEPTLAGYAYGGYWTTKGGSGTQKIDGQKLKSTSAVSADATWYAKWMKNASVTLYLADNPDSRTSFRYLTFEGNSITGSAGGNTFGCTVEGAWNNISRDSNGFVIENKFYITEGSYSASRPSPSDYVIYDIAYVRMADGTVTERPAIGWRLPTGSTAEIYLTPGDPYKITWMNTGKVDSTSWVGAGRKATSPQIPAQSGYSVEGWWSANSGGTKVCDAEGQTGAINADVTYYARYEMVPLTIRFFLAQNPSSRASFVYLTCRDGVITQGAGGSSFGSEFMQWPAVRKDQYGLNISSLRSLSEGFTFYTATDPFQEGKNRPSDYTIYDVAYAVLADGTVVERPSDGWEVTGDVTSAVDLYLTPGKPWKVSWMNGEDALSTTWLGNRQAAIAPALPEKTGYQTEWSDEAQDGPRLFGAGGSTGPITSDMTYYGRYSANRYTIHLDPNADDGTVEPETVAATYDQDVDLPMPHRSGFALVAWSTSQDGSGTRLAAGKNEKPNLTAEDGGEVDLYAQWTPVVSADVPIEVTARVDVLGIEEQVPASGHIESRSGGALKVAQVNFEPLAGAAELFGLRVSDVFLEALAEGSTAVDYRFPLDAAATETDATKLAAFALPDGYGTRVSIGYRFAIPDDVLHSIDPARFEQVTTPVCSVYYTVALAG